MSEFNGRRAPNFSQYLDDLNTVPSPYDQPPQQEQDLFDVDADLALFTNAEFFDFDSVPSNAPAKFTEGQQASNDNSSSSQDVKYMEMLNGRFQPVEFLFYHFSIFIFNFFYLSCFPVLLNPLIFPAFCSLLKHPAILFSQKYPSDDHSQGCITWAITT